MDLSDFFITKPQASSFTEYLNTIIDMTYTADFDLEKTLMQYFGMTKKDAFMKLLRENKIQETSISALTAFLKKIQEATMTLPLVTLTIAFEPTEETLKAFSQWFVFTLKKQVIFDISVDRTLVAGATITTNGKFKDYSLRLAFEKVIQQSLAPAVHTKTESSLTQSK